MKSLKLLVFLFLLCACSEDDLSKYSQLDELRMLGLRLDQPQIQDAATPTAVQLTIYVSDIKGSGRALNLEVFSCLEPSINRGEDPTCTGRADRQIQSQTIFDPNTAGTGMTAPHYTGDLTPITVTVPGNLTSTASAAQKTNGVGYLLEVVITGGSEVIKGITRVQVTDGVALNSNPSIDSILESGQVLAATPAYPAAETTFTATATAASAESYPFIGVNGQSLSLTESLTVSYLSSRGDFQFAQINAGESAKFTPDATSATPAVIAIVLRDGRGGLDVRFIRY